MGDDSNIVWEAVSEALSRLPELKKPIKIEQPPEERVKELEEECNELVNILLKYGYCCKLLPKYKECKETTCLSCIRSYIKDFTSKERKRKEREEFDRIIKSWNKELQWLNT